MEKIRVFISSVQYELEVEREWAKYALNKVPTLDLFFLPVLYEHEPASSNVAIKECVNLVNSCQVYVLIVGEKSGFMVDDISITHIEFKRAVELRAAGKMKILVFRKNGGELEAGAKDLLDDVRASGVKYKKFSKAAQLANEIEIALIRALKDDFNQPSAFHIESKASAKQILENASVYENLPTDCGYSDFDLSIAKRMIASWDGLEQNGLEENGLEQNNQVRAKLKKRLLNRNHLYGKAGKSIATMAGAIVLGKEPTRFNGLNNAYITAEFYEGCSTEADASEHQTLLGPALNVVEAAVKFVSNFTRKQERVVGIRRITIHEYPVEVIREVIVNAIAHRDYETTSARIFLRVFSNRVSVSSPGLPLQPMTATKLRTGEARAVSRNPLIAQSLLHLKLMEHRGSGFQRIRASVGKSGVSKLDVRADDGFLEVTLYGRGEKIGNLPLPQAAMNEILSAEAVADLNERQRKIAKSLVAGETLTRGIVIDEFGCSTDTAYRDLTKLVENGLAIRLGSGRSTRYIHPQFSASFEADDPLVVNG